MNITADTVKQLRERTGAGMMECKKALVETQGDLDAAAELMRKTGLGQGRQEGGASGRGRHRRGRAIRFSAPCLLEVNCKRTDFVAQQR